MSHFEPDEWIEFLTGGNVRHAHTEPIPAWAGFIITQLGELRAQIGALQMSQAISLHDQFQGDMTKIEAAYTQLVGANTTANTYSQQLLAQIAVLQGQIADPEGDPVSSDDLAQLNTFAATIQQAAAATVTTSTTTPPTTTPPAGTAPVDTTVTAPGIGDTTAPVSTGPDNGATTPSTPDSAPIGTDDATSAPVSTGGDAAPVAGSDSAAPTDGTADLGTAGTGIDDTAQAAQVTDASSQPVAIDATDSGAGASE